MRVSGLSGGAVFVYQDPALAEHATFANCLWPDNQNNVSKCLSRILRLQSEMFSLLQKAFYRSLRMCHLFITTSAHATRLNNREIM